MSVNPYWAAWRALEGPSAPTWAFMAFISKAGVQYRAARKMPRAASISDHDDYGAFVESRPFAWGIVDG